MKQTNNKRIILILALAACLFMMSACSFSDLMSQGAGVKNDPDFQTWEKLSDRGKLDGDGKYTADMIHVTFARNGFLEMKYYRDPELTQEISQENCYLLPGDLIYSQAKVRPESEAFYQFDHLEVIEYSEENVRGKKLNWSYGDNSSAILIPFDYKGTEIAVEPAGHYRIVTVKLEQPRIGGQVRYYVNNEELTGDTAQICCGVRIRCVLEKDPDWEEHEQVDHEFYYKVTEEENQVVSFEGKRVDTFFSETDGHKPTFRFNANRNVSDSSFTLEMIGVRKTGITANDVKHELDNKKIGTAEGIHIAFSSFHHEKNADTIRVTVVKKTDGGEYKEIHYAKEGRPDIQIDFERGIKYNEVSITMDAVKTESFHPIYDERADISARFTDVTYDNLNADIPLTEKDLVTPDRQIAVSIIPHTGYAMTGANTNEKNEYHREMKCSEYERYVKEALRDQLKKYCKITLDESDPYGEVVFKVDNEKKSGEIEILEGKEIVISYTLKDNNYELIPNSNIINQVTDWVDNLLQNKNGQTMTVTVTRDMDGKTIRREDFFSLREKVN